MSTSQLKWTALTLYNIYQEKDYSKFSIETFSTGSPSTQVDNTYTKIMPMYILCKNACIEIYVKILIVD